jgi:hypothetical protein
MGEDLKKIADDMMKEIGIGLNERARKDWGKTINIIFSDIDVGYAIKFAMDGSVEIAKGIVEGGILTANVMVPVLKDVMDGNLNALELFNGDVCEVEGDVWSLNMLMPALMPGGLQQHK